MFEAITDSELNTYYVTYSGFIDHGEPDCSGRYCGDYDGCLCCISGDTNPDDCLSSELKASLTNFYISKIIQIHSTQVRQLIMVSMKMALLVLQFII